MPGCDQLNRIGPDEYEMKMKMAISSVQGLFAGKVRIEDQSPPQSFQADRSKARARSGS